MYCTRCGSKISDQAKFCTSCGAPVDASNPQNAHTADEVPYENESIAVSSFPQGAEVSTASNAPAAEHATFAEAMDEQKRKSRKHIPTLLLIALVVLALSGIAYAAYTIYNNVIAPQPQTQEQPQVQTPEQQEDEPEESLVETQVVDEILISDGRNGASRKKYTYNESGMLAEIAEYVNEGEENEYRNTWSFSYERSNLVKTTYRFNAEESPLLEHKTSDLSIVYNDEGLPIEVTNECSRDLENWREVYVYEDGKVVSSERYFYGNDEYAQAVHQWEDISQPYSTTQYSYEGDLLIWAQMTAYTSPSRVMIRDEYYSYDENGRCTSLHVIARQGNELMQNASMSDLFYEYQYDDAGNLVAETRQDGQTTYEISYKTIARLNQASVVEFLTNPSAIQTVDFTNATYSRYSSNGISL